MRVTPYPVWAHLWAAFWTLVPAGLGSAAWWAVQSVDGDPYAPLRSLWHTIVLFLYVGTAALLAQLVVPALFALPALRRLHPAVLGLAAGALAASVVVAFGR